MSHDTVLIQQQVDQVVVATMNRPSKGNSLNHDLIDALDGLAAGLEAPQSGVGALVLTGAGSKAFSAGADITELDNIDGRIARAQMRRGQAVFDRLERLPVVVIAAINGLALGGGLELAMAADIRVAATTARLGQPEITLANLPGWGGTQRLPRLVGRALATELILTGDSLNAEEAAKIGLVTHVVEDAVAAAVKLGARIAQRSRAAVAGAKTAIRIGIEDGMTAGLIAEADAVADCCDTAEQKQAVQAFLHRNKLPPSGT